MPFPFILIILQIVQIHCKENVKYHAIIVVHPKLKYAVTKTVWGLYGLIQFLFSLQAVDAETETDMFDTS